MPSIYSHNDSQHGPAPCHTADDGDVLISTVMCAYPTQAGPDHCTAMDGNQPGHPAFVARTPTLVWLHWYDWGPDGFAIVPPASAEVRAHYGIGFCFRTHGLGPSVSDSWFFCSALCSAVASDSRSRTLGLGLVDLRDSSSVVAEPCSTPHLLEIGLLMHVFLRARHLVPSIFHLAAHRSTPFPATRQREGRD